MPVAALTVEHAPAAAPASVSLRSTIVSALFSERLAAFPLALVGLIDSVNPCALTTLIFLLAPLALAGRGRHDVLLFGVLVTLTVLVTYLEIGCGFFAVPRAARAVYSVFLTVRWALGVVLGFLVSMFEFASTEWAYLPMLGYLARMKGGAVALGLLRLHNLCFTMPLVAFFGESYFGVGSETITVWYQGNMGKGKFGLAAAFAAFAVFTLVG